VPLAGLLLSSRFGKMVAALILVRLLANWYVLDYAFGGLPLAIALLPAYGVPALAFALGAWMFRRRGDDLTVGVLEAGAVAFAIVLVALQIRQFATGGTLTRAELSFGEVALHVSSLGIRALASMRIATRLALPVLQWGWRIQGGLALLGGAILLLANPLFSGTPVGEWPLLDWLLPAYLLPAGLASSALRQTATERPAELRRVLALYGLIAGFVWITLEIRHLFHGPHIRITRPVLEAELWSWSGAWLAYGTLLLLFGLRRRRRLLRLAGLVIVVLSTAKVFIVDMGGLQGLWRVLSFLGLGLALIALGSVYRYLYGRGA
jgi:uncharacterized membrane protein